MTAPSSIPVTIPGPIPFFPGAAAPPPPPSSGSATSLYDVSIGGIGFMYANTTVDPNLRETAPFEKERIDQEQTPGEQTLTNWWIKSQDSFHGGAGQLQLEPAVPTPVTHVRYDASKNVDVFTPGQVTRLPDTAVVSADTASSMCSVMASGKECIAYISGGVAKLLRDVTGTPSPATFSGPTTTILALATDGRWVYAADANHVYQLDPTNVSTITTLATYPAAATTTVALGWVKAQLMLGVNGAVYGLDVSQTGVTLNTTTSPYFLYQHPTATFTWRCFSESPTAILAAGDALAKSSITQFTVVQVAGAPTLAPNGNIASMPVGERILSMENIEGTFLAIGTTKGIRIGQFDAYWSRLTYGPLELLPTDPTIPCNQVISRDRFAFAIGMAYDEGGLLCVDLGTKTDDAGRYAWSPHLISPTNTATAATSGCVLPSSSRIAFCIPGQGILLEGVGAGSGREAWLRTSRIRYDTTEYKLFKLGRVRGLLTEGQIQVSSVIPGGGETPLLTVGFVPTDPLEFRLPTTQLEWLQMKFTLLGSTVLMSSYGVKALPGTRRQLYIQPVLQIMDNETARAGQRVRDQLSTRGRLNALEQLVAAGDEVVYEEFTPDGVISTIVVLKKTSFKQIGRPTRTSDMGGQVTVLMQTVE